MADNDGKIYITISDRRFGKNKAEADEQNKIDKRFSSSESSQESLLGRFIQHQFFNLIESQATQAINYSIANIGNFTGDYVKQTQVAESMNILGLVTELGVAGLAGAKFGPVGVAVSMGTVTLSKVITINQQIYAGQVENTRINNDIAQLRTRAGLNSSNNGSRGTNQ